MFAILCRRRLRVPSKANNILVPQQIFDAQNVVLFRSCSSSVCENASEKPLTISYLVNSCGLSSNDALSVSKKVCFKSPENPDAVLKLLRGYGFTDAHHIPKIVKKWPKILLACPNKTLLPKFEFFRSIGVPLPVLAKKLSDYPFLLLTSLKNSIIPSYNDLKAILQSDERIVRLFMRSQRVFVWSWAKGVSSNVSMLRERGVPESSIVWLVTRQPILLTATEEKFAVHVDRAVKMGFDVSGSPFIHAIRVFGGLSESTLKRKMEAYKRCGCSESDIIGTFLKQPICMTLSEEKIMTNMNFLVNTLRCKPAAIARNQGLLNLSLEKRIKPRCLIVGLLYEKGLLKKSTPSMTTLLKISEENFLNRFIVKYEKDIPGLLDIYRGKLSPCEMGFSREVVSNLIYAERQVHL